MGPLVSQRQQQRVRDYIDVGQREGARLVIGGTDLPDGLERGWYVKPTLFAAANNNDADCARGDLRTGDPPSSPTMTRTMRWPLPTIPNTAWPDRCGLADTERALAIAARIRTGTLGINQGYTMDPFAPFGGVKGSGYGPRTGPRGHRRLPGHQVDRSLTRPVTVGTSDRNRCPRHRYLGSVWPGQLRRWSQATKQALNKDDETTKPSWTTAQSGRLSHVK